MQRCFHHPTIAGFEQIKRPTNGDGGGRLMEWQTIVGSSNISRIAYLPLMELCFIEYQDGTIYIYPWVNVRTWLLFVAAPSKGSFRHRYLKYGIKVFDPKGHKPENAKEFMDLLAESVKLNVEQG